MARSPRQPRSALPDWPSLAAEALLSHAQKMARGADGWAGDELRAAFLSRIAAGEDPLGDHYSRSVSAQDRRSIGATLTPAAIVNAMLGWAQREAAALGSPSRVVDPGAGTGRFAISAARAFPNAHVIAVENSSVMLALLRANLHAAGLGHRIEVVAHDFRAVELPPKAGPTLFLGNPPYVRHHGISPDWKRWYVNACARHGVKASQLAGLHLHFFAKIAELGREGDYGCLITAAEWLDVGYGAALRSLLANGLGGTEIHILEPTAAAFPGTMSTAAITGFRIGRRPPALRVRRVGKLDDLGRSGVGATIPWAKASGIAKWSLLSYSTPRPSGGTIELGEIFRVHRGQVTGNNRIWIAGAYCGELPDAVLFPTVTRGRELIANGPELSSSAPLQRVIDLPADLSAFTARERDLIDQFLKWATAAGGKDGYITSRRRPWWSVGLRLAAPILCSYMARRPPAFVWNACLARHINIAHGLYPREPLNESVLRGFVRFLRSNVSTNQGRIYAGGLTKFEPREIEALHIPHPEALDATF
jgi:Methyltransferase domain